MCGGFVFVWPQTPVGALHCCICRVIVPCVGMRVHGFLVALSCAPLALGYVWDALRMQVPFQTVA